MCVGATRTCKVCQATFVQRSKRKAEFCCNEHRFAYKALRESRGADAYDLLMNMRFNREAATGAELWSLLCRLASRWQEEDAAAGRVSYCRDVKELRMRHVAASATVVNRNAAGNKRRAA